MKKNFLFEDPIPEALRLLIENQSKMLQAYTPQITRAQEIAQQLTSCYDFSQLTAGINPAIQSFENAYSLDAGALAMVCSIQNVINTLPTPVIPQIEPPVLQWLQNLGTSPWLDFLNNVPNWLNIYIEPEKSGLYNKILLEAPHKARWFPSAVWDAEIGLATRVNEIISTTKENKKRTSMLDRVIFQYYTKSKVEELRKGWREVGLPRFKVKILNQTVYAYHRSEFVLTVNTLVSLWEGIIAEKSDCPNEYRTNKRTRENLAMLIDENGYDEIFDSFCEEFIFYDCRKPGDVIADVPGRHGIAHSWYDKYPSKKMALNAILFADFLLHLEPSQMWKK